MRCLSRLLVMVVAAVCFSTGGYALVKRGEIINVNARYRIAFTDLTEGDVKAGDIVSVQLSDGKIVLLDVVEAYPVMAKLSVSSDAANAISDDDFSKITVGAAVGVGNSLKSAVRPEADKLPVKPAPVRAAVEKIPGSAVVGTAIVPDGSVAERPLTREVPATGAGSDIDKITSHALDLSERLTRLLAEKENVENSLKQKDLALSAAEKKVVEAQSANTALTGQVKTLQAEINRLQALNADSQKQLSDTEAKLSELKKKLVRMVEIVNKNMRAYE